MRRLDATGVLGVANKSGSWGLTWSSVKKGTLDTLLMLVDVSSCTCGEFALHEILEPMLIWKFIVSAISNIATKNGQFHDLQSETAACLRGRPFPGL